MSNLDIKTLEYLAELGRIELTESEKPKLLKDLQEILNHFEELKKIDTSNVEPMSGGTLKHDTFREDKTREEKNKALLDIFPEKEDDFLKIPPVFE
jgi:aspartyl-tRNA(Asn)/glutamyl-tRNA(Gln) amidotransferase subunit C